MTYCEDYTLPADLLALLQQEGLAALPEALRILINTAMLAERQAYLGVGPYERGTARTDQANGFKPKTVKTRVGEVTFAVPQVRSGEFYPHALEKGLERVKKVMFCQLFCAWLIGPDPSFSTRSYAANARSTWRWPKCMSRACPRAK